MGQLIDDLLVFSRMGRQEMLRTTVNLDQLVKTVLHDLRLDLQGQNDLLDNGIRCPRSPAIRQCCGRCL